MKTLEYQDAIKAIKNKQTVFILPASANPNYLAFGVCKIHPLAIPVHYDAKYDKHAEIVRSLSFAKEAVLDTFEGEPYFKRKDGVKYYLI